MLLQPPSVPISLKSLWHVSVDSFITLTLGCIRLTLFQNKNANVTSKNGTYETFDAIRFQRRISPLFLVKMLQIYLMKEMLYAVRCLKSNEDHIFIRYILITKFTSKEKSGGYSSFAYSTIASIECILSFS